LISVITAAYCMLVHSLLSNRVAYLKVIWQKWKY